jgi:hypothetical protein
MKSFRACAGLSATDQSARHCAQAQQAVAPPARSSTSTRVGTLRQNGHINEARTTGSSPPGMKRAASSVAVTAPLAVGSPRAGAEEEVAPARGSKRLSQRPTH